MAKRNYYKEMKKKEILEELQKEEKRKMEKCYNCVWGKDYGYKFYCPFSRNCPKDKLK